MENKENITIEPIPEVGKIYHAFDDGKINPGRHMLVRIDEVIYNEHMKPWMVAVMYYESVEHDWIFDNYTDYIVKATHKYDDWGGKMCEDTLWFIRTKQGGWFSLAVDSYMDGCRLDVTGKLWNNMVKEYREYYSENEKEEFEQFVFENNITENLEKLDL